MKVDWQTKKLYKICTVFADGDWIEKKDQSAQGLRLVQTGNIGNSIFKDKIEKSRYISKNTFERLRCTEIFPNDCLISRLPDPVGRSCIIPNKNERMITSVDCTIVRFREKIIFPTWFIYYTLSQEYQIQINKQISGATRQRISRNNLGLIEIPLPPLNEQKCIITILDKSLAAIEKAKENVEKNQKNAIDLFSAYLQSILTTTDNKWQTKKLGDVCSIVNGGTPKIHIKQYWNGDISWITPKDMGKLKSIFVMDTERKITNIGLQYSSAKIIPSNSIILSTRAPIGYLAINKKEITTNQGCKGLVPNKTLDVHFLFYFLKMSTDYLNNLGSGATFKELSSEKLKDVEILIPPIIQQKYIISKLDALSTQTKELESLYEQKLTNLDELKKSILQKAFNGELLKMERLMEEIR